MAKRKRRRKREVSGSESNLQPWAKTVMREYIPEDSSPEVLEEKYDWACLECARLLAEPEFESLALEENDTLKALLEDLEWYQDELLSGSEKLRGWTCHRIHSNLLRRLVRPLHFTQIQFLLNECYQRLGQLTEPSNEEKDLFVVIRLFFQFMDSGTPLHLMSLFRRLLQAARKDVELPEDLGDELKQCLQIYSEYESLGEEAPPFQWVKDKEREPFFLQENGLDRDVEDTLVDLMGSIQTGNVSLLLLDRREVFDYVNRIALPLPDMVPSENELVRRDLAHQFSSEFNTVAREILKEIRGTDRWEQLKTDIQIEASNRALSAETDAQDSAGLLRALAASMDVCKKGDHPILRMLFFRQIMSMSQEIASATVKKSEGQEQEN